MFTSLKALTPRIEALHRQGYDECDIARMVGTTQGAITGLLRARGLMPPAVRNERRGRGETAGDADVRHRERNDISRQVGEFMRSGGRVQQIPFGKSGDAS